MRTYHKITTVWKRDPETKNKYLVEGEWATPEFEILKNLRWSFSEKIHGMNLRVMWDGERVRYGGRTETSDMRTDVLGHLQDRYTPKVLEAVFGSGEFILCGEGYGARVQKGGGRYLPDCVSFILFDVWYASDGVWLDREAVEDIGHKLDCLVVPILRYGTLLEAIEYCQTYPTSRVAFDPTYEMEGLVMRLTVELLTRRGARIITKIKGKDFDRDF